MTTKQYLWQVRGNEGAPGGARLSLERSDRGMGEVKLFLRRVRSIDRRIEREEEQLERLREKVEAGRMSAVTGMPRGGASDWTDTVDHLIVLEQRVNTRIREMCQMKRRAIDMIDRVEDGRYRELLDCYYLKGMTWEQVAEAMGYKDVRWVYVLHGRALKEVRMVEENADTPL